MDYVRRNAAGAIDLIPRGVTWPPDSTEFIMLCRVAGQDSRVIISWRARCADEARTSFLKWLGQPWLCTNLTLSGGPAGDDGHHFRSNLIDRFDIFCPESE